VLETLEKFDRAGSRDDRPTGMEENSARVQKPLHLILPATSANLGPAFDAAALAFEIT